MIARWLDPRPAPASDRQAFSNAALKNMILPLMIEQLLQLVVGIVDTIMVSYAGEATISGVSLVTTVDRIFLFLFTAVATGSAVIISQYLGRKKTEQAEQAAATGLRVAGILALLCLILAELFGDVFLRLLYPQVEPAVMGASRTYLRIVALSWPANAIYNAGAALFRSKGKTRTTMRISIAMNLLNAVGNAVGVLILHAGAAGVAWPTVISWIFAAALMLLLCMKGQSGIRIRPAILLRRNKDMAALILRVAIPNVTENVLFQLAKVALGAMVAVLGTVQIAANGIGQTFWSLGACVIMSFSPVFTTVIGHCVGAQDAETAGWYLRKLLRATLLMSIGWNLLVTLLVPPVLPFYAVTEDTRQLVLKIVVIHNLFSAFIEPFTIPVSSGFRAAGDLRFCLWSSIFCTVFFRTALAYLFGISLNMGIVGVAWAMVLDWTLKAILNMIRFRSGKWKQFQLI